MPHCPSTHRYALPCRWLIAAVFASACSNSSAPANDLPRGPNADPKQPETPSSAQASPAMAKTNDAQPSKGSALPADYDARVTGLLNQALAEDVLLAFYYLNKGKNPRVNYRWELHRSGALDLVHHSGKNPTFDVPFDQGLPSAPTMQLDGDRVSEIERKLQETDFFRQPAYQADPRVEDGDIVIVRARRHSGTHVVVYENTPSAIVEFLYGIAQ